MATKDDLKLWVLDSLAALGGTGRISEICKYVWGHHERELRESGDLFYTWQYGIRWAGEELKREGKLKKKGKNYAWYLVP